MASRRSLGVPGPAMTQGQIIGGLIYLPFFFFGTAQLLYLLLYLLRLDVSDAAVNLICSLIHLAALTVIFHRWYIASLSAAGRRFWAVVQAVILGFALYYALAWGLGLVFSLLELSAENPNNDAIAAMRTDSVLWEVVTLVLLPPLVEETVFRGLVFGNLRRYGRVLAYVVSAALFSFAHVFGYIGLADWRVLALAALHYLPAAAALAWCYERAEVVWAPMLLHGCINALALFVNSSG